MTGTETKFDPNWPHGWDIMSHGRQRTLREENVRILATDGVGKSPIIVQSSDGSIWKFSAEGVLINPFMHCRLVNRPATKAFGTDWVVRWGYQGREHAIQRFDSREDALKFIFYELSSETKGVAIKRIDWTEGEGL